MAVIAKSKPTCPHGVQLTTSAASGNPSGSVDALTDLDLSTYTIPTLPLSPAPLPGLGFVLAVFEISLECVT